MNQKIFTLGLSVETVSVYLMCCNLKDNDTTISTRNLSSMWNGEEASLFEGLKDLEERNILRKIISDNEENDIYRLSRVHDGFCRKSEDRRQGRIYVPVRPSRARLRSFRGNAWLCDGIQTRHEVHRR